MRVYTVRKTSNISLLLDLGVSVTGVLEADAGLEGNVLVRVSDARADDKDAVTMAQRFVDTVATLARRISAVYNINNNITCYEINNILITKYTHDLINHD